MDKLNLFKLRLIKVSMMKKIPTILGIMALVFVMAVGVPGVSATKNHPQVCIVSSSGNNYSSDSSMFVLSQANYNTCTYVGSGTSEWKAIYGAGYTEYASPTVCGASQINANVYDYAVGDNNCNTPLTTSSDYSVNVVHSHSDTSGSGYPIVETEGWSGYCSDASQSSVCYAYVQASYPP